MQSEILQPIEFSHSRSALRFARERGIVEKVFSFLGQSRAWRSEELLGGGSLHDVLWAAGRASRRGSSMSTVGAAALGGGGFALRHLSVSAKPIAYQGWN